MAEEMENTDETQAGTTAGDTTQLAQFENSLKELETLVEALETGNISLEQALAKFERGVTLTRQCRDLLKKAELRVDQLLEDGENTAEMTPPSNSADDASIPS